MAVCGGFSGDFFLIQAHFCTSPKIDALSSTFFYIKSPRKLTVMSLMVRAEPDNSTAV